MTIAVIWQEDGFQWCAADTRLVVAGNKPTTEIAAKIYGIPVAVSTLLPGSLSRQPHYQTEYGFVYAGAALPATMTAVTASTFLQKLAYPGDRVDPPTFEQIAELVHRLAKRFMREGRRFGSDGVFSAALFGWCARAMKCKVAHIDGRNDDISFTVDLLFPQPPKTDGDPWLVLGNGGPLFMSTLAVYRDIEKHITKRFPRRVIDKMVSEGHDPTVGGATSIGAANQHGLELFYAVEPVVLGQPAARRIFNGIGFGH